jgi:hypothetical protein
VWCVADFEHKYQFVLAAIKRSHAAIGLVPDAEVLEFGEHRLTGRQEFADMAPIHAYESNCAITAPRGTMAERFAQDAVKASFDISPTPIANSR